VMIANTIHVLLLQSILYCMMFQPLTFQWQLPHVYEPQCFRHVSPAAHFPQAVMRSLYALSLTPAAVVTLFSALSNGQNTTLRDDSLLWGPYRPNLYFGVRPRLPKSLSTGLMWTRVDDYNDIQTSTFSVLDLTGSHNTGAHANCMLLQTSGIHANRMREWKVMDGRNMTFEPVDVKSFTTKATKSTSLPSSSRYLVGSMEEVGQHAYLANRGRTLLRISRRR